MIQGGGFDVDFVEKEDQETIQNEAASAQPNKRGTLAMARTRDPHSASAQFFINVADNGFLNFRNESLDGWGYCVFGKVVEGMDVADKIAGVKTGSRNGHEDVPVDTILIEEVMVDEEA